MAACLRAHFRHILAVFWIALVIEASTGCETAAERLEPKTVDFIKPQITSRAELVKVFGPPTETVTGKERTLLFWQRIDWAANTGYSGSKTFSPSRKNYARGLSVLFDRDDKLVAKHYSEHSFHTYFGAGSNSIGKDTSDEVIARIKPNVTTKTEALAILGEPMMESLAVGGNLVLDWACAEGNYISGRTQLNILRLYVDESDKVVAVHKVNDH